MVRWIRFFFYGGLLFLGLAPHGDAIRLAVRVVPADAFFAPATIPLPAIWLLLIVALGYAVWLAGATTSGWRMPIWTHLPILGLAAFSLLHGPIRPKPDPWEELPPAERALSGLRRLASAMESGAVPLCGDPELYERLLAGDEIPRPGYRRHGVLRPWSVEVIPDQSRPLKQLEAHHRPGTVLLSCTADRSRFWLSAVVTDSTPVGAPTLVRDGVGKVAVLTGESP